MIYTLIIKRQLHKSKVTSTYFIALSQQQAQAWIELQEKSPYIWYLTSSAPVIANQV